MRTTEHQALLAELDRVHDALRVGEFSSLATAAQAITAGITQLSGADEATLTLVQSRAARNAACLKAAARGIRAARHRIAEIRTMEAGFVSYDKGGKRDGAVPPQITQRF